MTNEITLREDARTQMLEGIKKLADAVSITMGPKGRNVVIEKKFGGPAVTNDGVTIAKEIELEDKLENLGAQLVKQAASKTNDVAGDGTTTATVLAYAMITEGLKNIAAGANPMVVKTGMEQAVDTVVAELEKQAKQVKNKEEMAQVAAISAQNEEIGQLIAEAIDKVGPEAPITVEEGKTMGVEMEVVEGMQFDNGFISPYMVTDPARMEAVMENAAVLITDKKVSSIQEILPLVEGLAQAGQKQLVIIAEDLEGDALTTLVLNKLRGTFSVLAIKAPAFGDRRKAMLQDIAVLTGARVISEEVGLKLDQATMEDLGKARKVISTKDATTIVEGGGNTQEIADRAGQIRAEMGSAKSDYDKEKLAERVAKLSGGVAIIKVGAATEVELKEKKDRIEDALNATRAAVAEGIVAGGGTALAQAAATLTSVMEKTTGDQRVGVQIVARALEAPVRQIANNAGAEGSVVIAAVQEGKASTGYNAATDQYEDMFSAGIIDPAMVERSALQNAASVAKTFLTCDAAITELPSEEAPAAAPGGGMGGMGGMMGM